MPTPDSIESLCLGAPSQAATRIFKFPGIDTVRSDQLVKAQELHVDLYALGRVAVSPAREGTQPRLDEDGARLYVTENGGGVLVWWRDKPVVLRYAPLEPKIKHAQADVFAAAVAESQASAGGRLIYLLERPAGSTQAPEWRAFIVSDDERVCTQ